MSGRKTVFEGRIVTVDTGPVTLPNGVTAEMEFVRHPGGAAVVAVNDKREVCLLRHYREAVRDWLWELPAGKRDDAEDPRVTAQRELAEEAGCTAARWDDLGALIASPGVFTEVIHLYLARGLSAVDSHPEADEVFELRWLAFDEALAMARSGAIADGKSVAGLFRAAVHLEEND